MCACQSLAHGQTLALSQRSWFAHEQWPWLVRSGVDGCVRNQGLIRKLEADNRTSFYSNSSYRASGRQQAFHTLAVLTSWLPFEGQHNVRTGLEVSGRYWRHTADREPTCVTGEAGHYSRTLASKAGNHSRHLLLVRKNTVERADGVR